MNISSEIGKYIGMDKVAHFGVTFFISTVLLLFAAPWQVAMFVFIIALAKEIADRHNTLDENFLDMLANVAGIAAAIIINLAAQG